MIGIIGAMEEEVAELKKDMQIEETVEMAGMVFCKTNCLSAQRLWSRWRFFCHASSNLKMVFSIWNGV